MRDKFKDAEYFNNFINEDLARINKFSTKLKNGEVKSERISAVKSTVHDLKLGIIIAQYSRGDSIEHLEEEFFRLLDEWEEVWEPEYYNKNLKMISLALLFKVDEKVAKKIKNMLKESGINDWLLDFMLNFLDKEGYNVEEKLLFPERFSKLRKIVNEKKRIELLKEYLSEDWYNEDCGSYEAHKSRQNTYYGYWSFEAGAVAKILKIDDSSLKDVPYYPYDLVHYKYGI